VMLAAAGKVKSVSHDAIAAAAREHRLLNGHLDVGAAMQPAANLGVFSLIVLAHNTKIDFLRFAVAEGRRNALQQTNGAKVDVLFERTPDGNQQSPQRNMIGHAGVTNSS